MLFKTHLFSCCNCGFDAVLQTCNQMYRREGGKKILARGKVKLGHTRPEESVIIL